MDFGLIGNCQYSALIDTKGGVQWLCWPRFDSSFVFGSLLDKEKGGVFRLGPNSDRPGTQSYIANTNVLRTEFEDAHGSFELIDFAPRFYQHDRFYKPTMLVRILRPLTGEPVVRAAIEPSYDYGAKRCTVRFGSNHLAFEGAPQTVRLTTNASLSFVAEGRPFVLDRTYYFVLTYGQPLEASLSVTCDDFLERTITYWQTWVKHCYLPRDFQAEVIRSALTLKLHQFEDTGAIIASSTTSIPEAEGTVRNWDYRYCWLRDALFSLRALQRLTQFEEMEKFVIYLRNLVETMAETDERLQPVYGISGEARLTEHILDYLAGYRGHKPVRVGNQAYEHLQHDVYGEMILAISQLFLDQRFVGERVSPPRNLLAMLVDKIEFYLEAADAGLWEFRGIAQIHTFTLLMHWAGACVATEIARIRGYPDILEKATYLVERTTEIIDNRCWNEKVGAFTQAPGQDHLDAALLMMVNLGFLQPDDPRAKRHVDAIAKGLACEGGLIHRYVVKDDFGATTNAFTVCSFWLAEAYARIGENKKAEELFRKLLGAANHLGLYSEDLNPQTGEQWGNFPQTYSHVGLINAAFAISSRKTWSGYFCPSDLG